MERPRGKYIFCIDKYHKVITNVSIVCLWGQYTMVHGNLLKTRKHTENTLKHTENTLNYK